MGNYVGDGANIGVKILASAKTGKSFFSTRNSAMHFSLLKLSGENSS